MSISLIQRFSLQPLGKTPLRMMKDGFHLTTLSSVLKQRSSRVGARDEGRLESASPSLGLLQEGEANVFAVLCEVRLESQA